MPNTSHEKKYLFETKNKKQKKRRKFSFIALHQIDILGENLVFIWMAPS